MLKVIGDILNMPLITIIINHFHYKRNWICFLLKKDICLDVCQLTVKWLEFDENKNPHTFSVWKKVKGTRFPHCI